MKILGLLLTLPMLVFSLATTTVSFAASCAVDVAPETWATKLSADEQVQKAYLVALKKCLSGDGRNQAAIDTLAVTSLSELDKLPTDKQLRAIRLVMKALEINAKAGYASSQHNYAVLFNAPPGSLLSKLVKQDQMKFGN